MNTGDRVILAESSGDLDVGIPGWFQEPTGIIVRTGNIIGINPRALRAEQVSLFTYQAGFVLGYMLMPVPLWNFLRSAVNNIDGPVNTDWGRNYASIGHLMDEYKGRMLRGPEIPVLRHTVFEMSTLRVGAQPLYHAVINATGDALTNLLPEALERYERWCRYFKEQI